MKEEPVTIVDRDVLKVLSAETRMDILKELSEGARTPSFLGKKLNKSSATIIEHLELLRKAGLVKKIEQPGKKWTFYTLTDRGTTIISKKSNRLVIILILSFLSFATGAAGLINYSIQPIYYVTRAPLEVGKAVPAPQLIPMPIYLYISIIFFALAMAGFGFYIFKKSKI